MAKVGHTLLEMHTDGSRLNTGSTCLQFSCTSSTIGIDQRLLHQMTSSFKFLSNAYSVWDKKDDISEGIT